MAKHWELAKAFLLYCEIQAVRTPFGEGSKAPVNAAPVERGPNEDLAERYCDETVCRLVGSQQYMVREQLLEIAKQAQCLTLDEACPSNRVEVDMNG